jgi:ribonuclease BN (tRNA processing enzyme)
VELTVIGCSGSVSGPDSPGSCYLVQARDGERTFSLALDMGAGAFGGLYGVMDPSELDAVALSHLHPDHCIDLCALYVGARYSPTAPWPTQTIYGPTNTAARIQHAYEAPATEEPGPGIADQFNFVDWQPAQRIGPFEVTTTRVDHPVEAYAIRITDTNPGGGSLVFSGDTGPSPALVAIAENADLLLVEASFLDVPGNPTGLHLNGREAAVAGSAAGVGTVVLTHIPPWHDPRRVLTEATPHFSGPVQLATVGAHWSIGAP